MNYCPGIGKSGRTWRPAQREDQNTVGLGGWLPFKTRKNWAKVRKIVAGKDQNTPSDLLEKVPNF
jgi:hypothetical protein